MTMLNNLFISVRSFRDFVDTYQAHYGHHNMSRNDFVRAARILAHYRATGNHRFESTYRALNISQSSEPVFRSKMNKMFRTLGLLDDHRGGIRLMFSDMTNCVISLEAVRIQNEDTQVFIASIARELAYVDHSGRSQDRTTARHQPSHRRGSRGTRRTFSQFSQRLRDSRVNACAPVAQYTIPDGLEGFDPFAGVAPELFAVLEAEAR